MFYPAFLFLTALEMLGELVLSLRNSHRLVAQGAVEVEPKILPIMASLYVLMYFGSLAEYYFLSKTLPVWWICIFLGIFLIAKTLKFWAVFTLGKNWTMRVLILPESATVNAGPYRWIRHPNYVAVILEIVATTLLGRSFITFAAITASFSLVLWWRIRTEEEALHRYTDYAARMKSKRRFIP